MGKQLSPESFLPLPRASVHILASLAAGPSHGYAIAQDIDEMTGGMIDLSAGTLYTALGRLAGKGLITEAEHDPNADDRRRPWKLTQLGEEVVRAEYERVQRLATTLKSRMAA